MAVIDGRLVYRDGANVSSAPATSYQIADDFSGYFQGASGDLLYVKSAKQMWMSDGTTWIPIYTSINLPPYPTSLPPSPLNGTGNSPSGANYTLTDNNDLVLMNGAGATLFLHSANTAKKKPYYIKAWYSDGIIIKALTGEVIDILGNQITINNMTVIALFPYGSNTWIII